MKNKIKKISALVCALIVAVSAFVSVPYYASIDYDYTLPSADKLFYEGVDLPYYSLFEYKQGELRLVYSEKPLVYYYDSNNRCYGSPNGGEWYSFWSTDGKTWKEGIRYGQYSGFPCTSGVWNMIVENGLSSTVGIKYAPSLGYLNNARIETTFLTTDHGKEVDYSSFRKTLKFDKLSTTGIDLSSGDYVIRVYGQMCYQKTTTDEIYDDNFPFVYFGDFEIINNSISYNSQDLFDLISGSTEDPYSVWDIWTKAIHRSDIEYYQIYNKNTHECGGYLKVVLGGAEGSMYSQTTLKDDMSVDSEGFEDKNLIGSAGSGTTYEDAEINADKNYNDLMNNGGIQGLEGAINAFTSTLGVVPQAIGSVFSFLPSWCLDLWGVAFGLIAVLIVYKILRG